MNWSLNFSLHLLVYWLSSSVVQSHHILGLFVNVHRSQLLVHLAVARVLLERGHQLTLVTTLPLDDLDEEFKENVTHILVDWQPSPEEKQSSNDFLTRLEHMFRRLEHSGNLLKHSTWKNFMAYTPKPNFDLLLLGYQFNDHLLGVAAHFKCPVVIITTQQPIGQVNSLMGNPEERWYVPQPYDSRQRSGLEAWIFGWWEKTIELLSRRILARIYSKNFPSPQYPDFDTMRRSVVMSFNNHHMISEGPIQPMLPTMLDIGGILIEQTPKEKSNLEISSKRPRILFSLGTRFIWSTASRHFIDKFVASFEHFPDFDIYWTYDGSDSVNLTQAHPHLKLAKWWPQRELLASNLTRVFITHGGKGSITESLYYGKPILGLPLVGDQRVNAVKVVQKNWGLSLNIHNCSSFDIIQGIHQLLDNPIYAKTIEKASQLYRDRPQNATEVVSYWLEYILRHNGAKHLYNPARELYFWQYYSIDIHFTIYSCLVLLILTLIRLDQVINKKQIC
ncbi:UDP-glycosyltransferase UGT5 [Drosophila tropicalis]|uniref:UDP-glycosyltransferase UGT5 n=1 Tax=Drosophila tropicalis TaxID=46794 RepID=UPI0035AB6BF2